MKHRRIAVSAITGEHRPALSRLRTALRGAIASTLLACATVAAHAQLVESDAQPHVIRMYPVHHQVKAASDVQPSDTTADATVASTPTVGPAPRGAKLVYDGGPVISNVSVVIVYYGQGSYLPQLNDLPNFYSALSSGTTMDVLSEYSTMGVKSPFVSYLGNQVIEKAPANSFVGSYTIIPSPAHNGSTIDDSQIEAELQAQISSGHLPPPTYDGLGNANTIYMIYFPHGKTITAFGSQSCVGGGFCAYHATTVLHDRNVLYGVQPDMQSGSGCDTGCGNSASPYANYTEVGSHEFAETVTDAAVGLALDLNAPPLAWYDDANGEIGDICNDETGTANGYTVQLLYSNLQKACVDHPVYFSVSAPSSATAGSLIAVTVQTKNSNGSNQTGYLGTVHFTSTDAAATLPADYTFTSADAGAHVFGVKFGTNGNQTITVTGVTNVGFTGTSSDINVTGAPAPVVSLSGTSVSFPDQSLLSTSAVQQITLTNTGNAALSISSISASGASFSQSNNCGSSISASGHCTISVTFAPQSLGPQTGSILIVDNNNDVSNSTQTVSLGGNGIQATQTIQFASLPDVKYGTSPITLLATASSGLTVSYAVSGPATLSGTTLTITGAGQVSVTASQSGNTTYQAAKPVTQSFQVNKAVLTVSPHPPLQGQTQFSVGYGNNNPLPSDLYVITGFVNGETAAVISGAPTVTPVWGTNPNVGTYALNIGVGTLSAANYSFIAVSGTITVVPAVLTVKPNSTIGHYGAALPTLTYTVAGLKYGQTAAGVFSSAPQVSTTALQTSDAGQYPVSVNVSGVTAANYVLTAGSNATLTILPATLVVKPQGATMTAGSPLPTFTYVLSGLVNGDNDSAVSGSPLLTTTATSASPVGKYPIMADVSTMAAKNYKITAGPNAVLTVK